MTKLLTIAQEAAELDKERTSGEWTACTWDPMERPHVTTAVTGACHGGHDLPRTAADARFIAHACNHYGELARGFRELYRAAQRVMEADEVAIEFGDGLATSDPRAYQALSDLYDMIRALSAQGRGGDDAG